MNLKMMADEEVNNVTASRNINDITERQDLEESDNFSDEIERESLDLTIKEGETAKFDKILNEKKEESEEVE